MTEAKEMQIRDEYRSITLLLIEKGLTITTMESATGGQIASLITDTEGSSAVLKGAFVTYSNEAKAQQGVDPAIIERYSVYSKETAAAMAEACAHAYGADIGIGVTGTMGNTDSANPESSEQGSLFYAICLHGRTCTYHVQLPPAPTRLAYKLHAAELVGQSLLEVLTK